MGSQPTKRLDAGATLVHRTRAFSNHPDLDGDNPRDGISAVEGSDAPMTLLCRVKWFRGLIRWPTGVGVGGTVGGRRFFCGIVRFRETASNYDEDAAGASADRHDECAHADNNASWDIYRDTSHRPGDSTLLPLRTVDRSARRHPDSQLRCGSDRPPRESGSTMPEPHTETQSCVRLLWIRRISLGVLRPDIIPRRTRPQRPPSATATDTRQPNATCSTGSSPACTTAYKPANTTTKPPHSPPPER
jgi:hypothetical protein